MRSKDYLIVVRAESPDQFVAYPLGIPELRDVGTTEAEAVDRACQSLSGWLKTAKLVRVGVPDSSGDPWIEGFGRSADDPDFPAPLEEIRGARLADSGN